MSKRFRRQNSGFYQQKLGTKWRKPKGHHSKQRVGKGGSEPAPGIGYGTKKEERLAIPVIRNLKDIDTIKNAARIAAGVGARNVIAIAQKAKKAGVKILNMKKVKRAERIAASISDKKADKKNAAKIEPKADVKTEKPKEQEKPVDEKAEPNDQSENAPKRE